jgi:autotransporter passenger strand-loop-strand repeat protein
MAAPGVDYVSTTGTVLYTGGPDGGGPPFNPLSTIQITSAGPVSAVFQMAGNGEVVTSPGLSLVIPTAGPPPLYVNQDAFSSGAMTAAQLSADLQQLQVSPFDPNGGIASKFGYGPDINMTLTVTDLMDGSTTVTPIADVELNAGPPITTTVDNVAPYNFNGAVVNRGGILVNDGLMQDTTVNAGGSLHQHSLIPISWSLINAGGTMAVDTEADGTTLNGGTMWDNAGGIANSTTINQGGVENVYNGATSNGSVIKWGGMELVNGGSVSNGNIIGNNGYEGVWGSSSGDTIYAGGKLATYNGGVEGDVALAPGGMAFIRPGGIEAGTVTFGGPNAKLTLQTAANGYWSSHIAGFGSGDTIDFANVAYSTKEQEAFSGGALYLASGTQHSALQFSGALSTSSFWLSNDGTGGTLVHHT